MAKNLTFAVCPALSAGENYSSQIIRATVSYQLDAIRSDGNHNDSSSSSSSTADEQSKTYIIKASLGDKLIRSCDTFAKEIGIFTCVLPKVERLLRDAEIPTKIAPA